MMLHVDGDVILADSNPGHVFETDGGVGRNIAENLGRLGHQVTFLTVLGEDRQGLRIQSNLQSIGITVIAKKVSKTPVYAAVMDAFGDLVVAVNDMEGLAVLDDRFIQAHKGVILNADVIVLEGNLMTETLIALFEVTKQDVPTYADGISASKVKRLMPILDRLEGIKVNRLEALTLSGLEEDATPEAMCQALMALGIKKVFLSLGVSGVMMADAAGMRHHGSLETAIISASGAGDALFSGIIHGMLRDLDPLMSGLICATLSLRSKDPVFKSLTSQLVKDMMEVYKS
jgi:pseudouridine kinase